MTFAQNSKSICFKCGKQGHDLKNCVADKDNKLAKTEWWINKPGNKQKFDDYMKKVQFATNDDTIPDNIERKDPHWTGVHNNT